MNGFGVENLPFGVARWNDGRTGCVSALDGQVIELATLARAGGLPDVPAEVFDAWSLNGFLSLGRAAWAGVRTQLADLVTQGDERLPAASWPMASVELLLPISVGDFVDFSASLHHATNMARLLRPGSPPPGDDWKRFPRGFHGRAGSIVVSGTPFQRPHGPAGATTALDIEAELAFVIGTGNRMGEPIPASAMRDHVAGVMLLLDWSARDIQAGEQHHPRHVVPHSRGRDRFAHSVAGTDHERQLGFYVEGRGDTRRAVRAPERRARHDDAARSAMEATGKPLPVVAGRR